MPDEPIREIITLILAYDRPYTSDEDVHLFHVKHYYAPRDHKNLREAFRLAFKDWYNTRKGKKYVEENGSNWGDALQLPEKHLLDHGIVAYGAMLQTEETGRFRLMDMILHDQMSVDHNESLLAN
jgi:hypothetical protein